ncbi:hypothetical protein L207DRAFT_514149 [Hyaloscypha variabilis F]|uniref:Uncharacterized protein n=1 Tax=Hyaloscypha variabilis (strain UAMH 11265 / GT02V1 / F) TaxID=1149755 RepID=A0A2J6RI86_HYAVF|nr:hypothetical protein L207DRAFT_514149 [Hyaloscypha variabilis F]
MIHLVVAFSIYCEDAVSVQAEVIGKAYESRRSSVCTVTSVFIGTAWSLGNEISYLREFHGSKYDSRILREWRVVPEISRGQG